MPKAFVKEHGNVPTLFIDDQPVPAVSYITYFHELGRYQDFAEAGYNLFSLVCNFAGQGINPVSQIAPFTKGIFDDPEQDDFSVFDEDIQRILDQCPNALIFPRVNLSMPIHWERAHPEECNDSGVEGRPARYCFSSDLWLKDAGDYLRRLIKHVAESPYAENIIGYHLAAGSTEEWMPMDQIGSIGETARKKFEERYPDDPSEANFYRFLNEIAAEDIAYFAAIVKQETNGKLVGVFYGYLFELPARHFCHHALNKILDCKDIDFFCSPMSYTVRRKPEQGSILMMPLDSLKLHGKMYFAEYDTRTHLTKHITESRKNACPPGQYVHPNYFGHDKRLSLGQLRMNMAQQLAQGTGSWWFDMWSGWFMDQEIMHDMKVFRDQVQKSLSDPDRTPISEIAVFTDERSADADPNSMENGPDVTRHLNDLGQIGVPISLYEICDFEKVIDRYRFAIFFYDLPTDPLDKAVQYCQSKNIPHLVLKPQQKFFTPEELREIFAQAGIHLWCNSTDAVYVCKHFISLHAATAGEKVIYLNEKRKITPVIPAGKSFDASEINVRMEQGDTVIYRLD